MLIPIVTIVLLAGTDQMIKHWALGALAGGHRIDIIANALTLIYHENTGAAFGILQEQRFLLVGVTGLLLSGLIFVIATRRIKDRYIVAGLTLIAGGGIGNLIDRVFRGYVIDYIYFSPINFPVFNFGDCCVVIGTGLLMVYVLFWEEKLKKGTTQ